MRKLSVWVVTLTENVSTVPLEGFSSVLGGVFKLQHGVESL